MRELTRAWLAAHATTVTVTKVENPSTGDVFRTVSGHFTVPLFLDSTNPAAKLTRDANGHVQQNGTAEAEFVVVVPVAVKDGPAAGKVAFYGHGFFGNLDELTGGGAVGVANATQRSLVGTVWWGMSLADVLTLVDALSNSPAQVLSFADRVHQAHGELDGADRLARGARGPARAACAPTPRRCSAGRPTRTSASARGTFSVGR